MGTDKVRLNDDGSYTIEVYQPTSIVLVTEKPAPDDPGDEIDPGFSSGAAALGIVLGTAGLGYITYAHISSLYLYYTLPGGFIPSTRQEAGKRPVDDCRQARPCKHRTVYRYPR